MKEIFYLVISLSNYSFKLNPLLSIPRAIAESTKTETKGKQTEKKIKLIAGTKVVRQICEKLFAIAETAKL